MTHLGDRITPLVDGQLPPDAAERAYAHIASCPACREAVDAERLVKSRLAALGDPTPDAVLTSRLLRMATPGDPVPPRGRPVPGSPREHISASAAWGGTSRPPGRPDGTRPVGAGRPTGAARRGWGSRRGWRSRSPRVRALAAVAGALCLVGAAALTVGATGIGQPPAVVPPVDQFVVDHGATTVNMPYGNPAGTGR